VDDVGLAEGVLGEGGGAALVLQRPVGRPDGSDSGGPGGSRAGPGRWLAGKFDHSRRAERQPSSIGRRAGARELETTRPNDTVGDRDVVTEHGRNRGMARAVPPFWSTIPVA